MTVRFTVPAVVARDAGFDHASVARLWYVVPVVARVREERHRHLLHGLSIRFLHATEVSGDRFAYQGSQRVFVHDRSVFFRVRVPSTGYRVPTASVTVVHRIDDPDDCRIDGGGLLAERIAGGLALDYQQHSLSNTGAH